MDHTHHHPVRARVATALIDRPPRRPYAIRDEPDEPMDVRLYAPTPDTVIVWVAGPLRRTTSPLLTLRVRQQLHRAAHVILDLTSVSCMDSHAAADLHALHAQAEGCGTQLHIAGAGDDTITGPLRRLEPDRQLVAGPAAAVLAALVHATP